jgi:hypothetical protein
MRSLLRASDTGRPNPLQMKDYYTIRGSDVYNKALRCIPRRWLVR